ncbi:MAG TPA: hypothetical protein VJT09_00710 [Pyrinomonadaceae bacterium]|nr:hypothetical protein [Pyrinomonadaceae bacterium]
MSIPFKCTSCGGPLEYEAGGALTIRCPFCDSSIIVPEELRPRPAASSGGFFDGIFKLHERAANLQEIARLARSGEKIKAIKLYREIFGVGLEEAKIAVERMSVGQQPGVNLMASVEPSFQAQTFNPQTIIRPVKRFTFAWVIIMLVIAGITVAVGLIIKSVVEKKVNEFLPSSKSSSSPFSSGSSEPGFASVALKFGTEGIGPGMFKDARSIAVDGEGRIYVGEYLKSGRIQVFDSAGKFITQWMVDPKMPLRDLTVDRKGTVYVVQRGEINRFEGTSGQPLGKLEYGGNERAYFDDARVTADGGLVAAMNSEDLVRFNSGGRVLQTIRKSISTQTGDPVGDVTLAVDGLGNIYALSDGSDSGVFKFSPEGRFLNRFGSSGEEPGQFRALHAIAVDGRGRIYVSDVKGIQVFDSNGRYLDVFKVDGNVAFGLTFNDRNELFVAARTQVIKYVLNK